MKRTVLFVVDALSEPIVREWLAESRLPAIAELVARGGNVSPCTSIFPSITPAATCSIATGEYPRQHGIEGACWHNADANDTAYFGDDVAMARQEGMHNYLVDFADQMNFKRLNAPLVYEHLFDAGIESACVNFMWFRGPHVHSRSTPLSLRLTAGKLVSDVRGPKVLKLGDFVHSLPKEAEDVADMKTGLLGRYGFHDQTTAACMISMARTDTLPAFSLAYFPLNDDHGHKNGLHAAASQCVESFDEFLGQFVEALGGWHVIDKDYSLLIVGDHGQTEWADTTPDVVELDQLLADFKIAETVSGFKEGDELLICPNMRAAAIYRSRECGATIDDIASKLLEHRAIDQAIYLEKRTDNLQILTVRTRDRGRLAFTRNGELSSEYQVLASDCYGNRWSLFGELSALDLNVGNDGKLVEGDYPNALERIEGAFTAGPSPIWLTAKPNAEFAIGPSSTHSSGSHGALHRKDSIAALITTHDVDLTQLLVPSHPRITDVMDLCLKSLGANRRGLGVQAASVK
ncbi:MAG: alkaline phosphatase family protein [Pirellulaceae bacterium]